jgi:hypothetical protein
LCFTCHREADITKERIEKVLKAGANVILTTKGIDDMALKYFVEANAIAVRRVGKEDMRHIAKATGATQVRTTMTFNSSAYLIILFPISFRRPQNYHFENEGLCALAFYFLSLRMTNVLLGQISLILCPFLFATTPNSIF